MTLGSCAPYLLVWSTSKLRIRTLEGVWREQTLKEMFRCWSGASWGELLGGLLSDGCWGWGWILPPQALVCT